MLGASLRMVLHECKLPKKLHQNLYEQYSKFARLLLDRRRYKCSTTDSSSSSLRVSFRNTKECRATLGTDKTESCKGFTVKAIKVRFPRSLAAFYFYSNRIQKRIPVAQQIFASWFLRSQPPMVLFFSCM